MSSPLVALPSPLGDGCRTDPDRLIEDAFCARDAAEAPDTLVLAWLALLEKPADAPLAASRLAARLLAAHTGRMSFWQARLIELLAFVAQHTRSPSDGSASSSNH